jgi:hypothetical protein
MVFVNSNPNRQNKTNKYFQEQRAKINTLKKNKRIISKQILNRWEAILDDDCVSHQIHSSDNNCKTVISISKPVIKPYIPAPIRPSVWINYEDDYNDNDYILDYIYDYEDQIYNRFKKN